ncbi:thiamine pyrophosphate-binding protein [Pseudonocardia halophobica]|uniref:thiamine pyrophosphate-binding protein n=1 Tax=Pseudonocardia halophobica TaxID=29401 RepID=UPI003D8E3292
MFGYEILARELKEWGTDTLFFLMGGPMIDAENACEDIGIRMVDVRHEQAAVMMANAHTRITGRPSVAMACSGPGMMNMVTGIAHAWSDGAPIVVIGGASELSREGTMPFQETDQLAVVRPITKLAIRCTEPTLIPDVIARAFRTAVSDSPGPVYVDLPGDVLYAEVAEAGVPSRATAVGPMRTSADPDAVRRAVDLLAEAERPIVVSGSGVVWSGASDALTEFVDTYRTPFYTTPMGRGVVSEKHPLSLPGSRSAALRDCDLVLQVATRQNYIFNFMQPPKVNGSATLLQIDVSAAQIGANRAADVGLVGDARAVLRQLLGHADVLRAAAGRHDDWIRALSDRDRQRQEEVRRSTQELPETPIHPRVLSQELADWLPDGAILSLDGHEILTMGRQFIPLTRPYSLNSGAYGTMGVGLPFGIGAKVARPDSTVVVLSGDGSFGFNALELDTAVRHRIPVICVISNNGGWTATDRRKAGSDLGHMPYERMFESLGCLTTRVETIDQLRPALDKAQAFDGPSLINVITDRGARATTSTFTKYVT